MKTIDDLIYSIKELSKMHERIMLEYDRNNPYLSSHKAMVYAYEDAIGLAETLKKNTDWKEIITNENGEIDFSTLPEEDVEVLVEYGGLKTAILSEWPSSEYDDGGVFFDILGDDVVVNISDVKYWKYIEPRKNPEIGND